MDFATIHRSILNWGNPPLGASEAPCPKILGTTARACGSQPKWWRPAPERRSCTHPNKDPPKRRFLYDDAFFFFFFFFWGGVHVCRARCSLVRLQALILSGPCGSFRFSPQEDGPGGPAEASLREPEGHPTWHYGASTKTDVNRRERRKDVKR